MINTKNITIIIGCLLLILWTLIPIYWLFNISFMYHAEAYTSPAHFFPEKPTISNYLRSLGFSAYNELSGRIEGPAGYPVKEGLINSAIVAIVVAIITVIIASPAGYALGRLKLPRKNLLLILLLGSRTLPPVAVLIPFYIIGLKLGLVGNIFGLIIMHLSITLPLMTWILMGFFASLPIEIEKASRIDGCTRWQSLLYVVFPMALPGIVAIGLLSFLTSYNEYLFAWIFTQGTSAVTLQPVLATMWFMIGELNIMAAANAMGLIVPIITCILFQKYIIRLRIVDPVSIVIK